MPDEIKDTQPLIRDILDEMRSGFAALREEMQAGFRDVRGEIAMVHRELELINRHLKETDFQLRRALLRVDVIEEYISQAEKEANPQ